MSKTLNECCFFQEGYVNPPQDKKEYFDGNIKWLRSLDLNNSFVYETSRTLTEKGYNSAGKSAYMFPADTIAISKSGTVGELGILKDTMCGNRAIIDIQVDGSKADLLYVFYLLRYKKKEIISKAVGSIQKNLYCSALGTIELCHDDINEQKRISGVLGSIDEKIRNNNAINDELETMARTIYNYWFLQFEFPDENGKPYKSSGGKMVWNEELKRDIPDGWKSITLGKLFSITMGSSPKGDTLNESKNGTEFYQGSTDFEKLYPTERVYTTAPIRMAKAQDILMSVRAPVGAMNIAMNDCCIGRGLAAINHKSTLFAWNTLKTFQKYFDIFNGNGTTFGALTSDDFKEQLTIEPTKNIVDKYCEIVKSFEEQIRILTKENQKLASLRDFLLPLLMNGQVTFKESE